MTDAKHISTDVIAITLQVSLWGARKKLQVSDLGDNAHLPPDTLASLGSKKICDHKDLRIFGKLKARAENVLKKAGVNNLIAKSSYIIPTPKAEEVVKELREIKTEFDNELNKFLSVYDERLEEWLVSNDEWREIIEGSLISKKEVRNKIGFGWVAFCFGETNMPGLDSELDSKLAGLSGQLFKEVAQIAAASWEKSFECKDTVQKKATGPLKTIREKLNGFEIVSNLVTPIVEDIDRVLVGIPNNGQPISGMPLIALHGILHLLKDPRQAMDYAERKLAGVGEDEDPFASWTEANGFIFEKPKEHLESEEENAPAASSQENNVSDSQAFLPLLAHEEVEKASESEMDTLSTEVQSIERDMTPASLLSLDDLSENDPADVEFDSQEFEEIDVIPSDNPFFDFDHEEFGGDNFNELDMTGHSTGDFQTNLDFEIEIGL